MKKYLKMISVTRKIKTYTKKMKKYGNRLIVKPRW